MSLNTSNDPYSHRTFTYTSPPCYFYSWNSSQAYQLPISFKNSFIISDEQTQLKQTANTRLPKKIQSYNSNVTTKHSYQSMNSTEKIPISSDDYKINKIHRSDSHKDKKHQQFVKQQSLHKLLSPFQRSKTTDDSQQWDYFPSITDYCCTLRDQATTISNERLAHLLCQFALTLKSSQNSVQPQQQLPILIDILNALLCVQPSILAAASQNEFFSIFQISFIHILCQWRRLSSLSNNESFMFHTMVKLIQMLIKATDDVKLIPSWLSDSTLLEAISSCLEDIATTGTLLDKNNKSQFKSFTRLIDAYILYQQRLNNESHSGKDTLVQLLDPILHCLTSSRFINTFANMAKNAKSMTMSEKFFLIKCPAFLTSYNGSRLEQTMESLLSTMLPQYVQLLDKLVPSAPSWNRPMIRSVQYLLKTISHGADQFQTNAKLVRGNLPLIDHVLKLVNEPIFYNNLLETLSDSETTLMNTAISLLVHMISEPAILAHIKQCQVADVFLRLTSCQYEPLVLNVYTLLAYTTHEDDIKAMHDSGRLLATIIESIKTKLNEKPERKTQIEQLLETLQGLVQHDQIKDEIIKQNALPFLVECTNKLTDKPLVLIFEILWCLTFFEEIACTLRSNLDFLEKIQTISKDNTNEPLKKAADGLVWKLIREPASFEKVVQQEEKEEVEPDEIITTREVVIGEDGKEQIVTRTKRGNVTPTERLYRYDIMISYCHIDRELTYKIHKFLVDQGFKVWIDLDNLYGPAMSAMADAVENSEFVLMCMSDSYKQSTYCQAEAEYAFKCKRRLIPLVMRQGYKPDGWLGFMIGSRLYVDFGRHEFDLACEKLVTEIGLQRKQTVLTVFTNPLEHKKPVKTFSFPSEYVETNKKSTSRPRSQKPVVNKDIVASVFKARQSKLEFIRKPIDQWTESDVLDFLLAHRLNELIPLCEAMNGRALIQLYKICISHRLRAYSIIKTELKSVHKTKLHLNVYSRFLSITEEAINSIPIPSMENPSETITSMPFIPAPNSDMSYDFLITTNSSPLDTLKMVERYGSQLQFLDSLRRQVTNVF